MSQPQTGDRINNYILEEPVGAGSFGQVWRARHHMFDERVAIKIPTDAQYVQNLRREGVTIHGLRHPNIVRALDLDPYADPPYYIMEYVDGLSLRQIIDAHSGGLPLEAIMPIFRGMVSALEASHEAGLVHRDIKPANIMIVGGENLDGMTEDRVKVTDFGLGQAGGDTTVSILQSGSLVTDEGKSIAGTLAYMAPEQRDGQDVDARADLYACGVVLFEMLTGTRPQGGDRPSQVRSDGVPELYDALFARCYTGRDRRFASAAEVLAFVESFEHRPPTASAGTAPLAPSGQGSFQPPVGGPNGLSCPSCRGLVDQRDHFCIHCGLQLVDQVPRCPQCGAFPESTDNYCIKCGTNMRETAS